MSFEGKFHPMGSGRRDIRGRSCTVYIFGACVEKLGVEELESVCQTGYNCVSVSTYLIGSGFFIGSQN